MTHFRGLGSSRLAYRLAGYIILFSSALALLITATELTLEYRRDVERIDERMRQVETAYLDSIVENVWVGDRERLETLLSGITRLPDFVQAEVLVDGRPLVSRGGELRGAGVTSRFPLRRMHRGKLQDIGELVVSASYRSAFLRALDRLLFFLLANGTKTLIVGLFIFVLFYRLIGRHIETMAGYARKHADVLDAPPLRLPVKSSRGDELTDLAHSINLLHGQLSRLGLEQRQRADDMAHQAEELTRELQARKKIQAELDLMALVFQSSSEAIIISDAQNRILAVNEAFTKLTGYAASEVVGQNPRMLSAGRTEPEVYGQMWSDLREQGNWQGELWDRRKDGQAYPKWLTITAVRDEDRQVSHYIGIFSDISERKKAQEAIYHLAHHDSLTGLANRLTLQQELDRLLHLAQRGESELAVMFIDLDRFKYVNDAFGHDAGDRLLVEVSRRLKTGVRGSDLVARLGGDEFVVILPDVDGPVAAAVVADKLRELLARPYSIDDKPLTVTPSIGLALYPADGADADALMKHADSAMYHAKAQGRNNVQFFSSSMEKAARERIDLERDLRQAIALEQLELHFQPLISSRTGLPVGAEALLRWRHPQHGLVSPAKFIPIAEESGMILPLGDWVIHEACRQLRVWKDQGLHDLRVSVNLSIQQLGSASLLGSIDHTLRKFGLGKGDLELEITESSVMQNAETSIGKLQALREMGVGLAIDDFGTGYSSLSYLQRLPIHALKLDQSFVRDMESNPGNATICASTIALAHGLDLAVVAEGVETEAQRRMLVSSGCDSLQGYLFSRPLPADEVFAFLAARIALAKARI